MSSRKRKPSAAAAAAAGEEEEEEEEERAPPVGRAKRRAEEAPPDAGSRFRPSPTADAYLDWAGHGDFEWEKGPKIPAIANISADVPRQKELERLEGARPAMEAAITSLMRAAILRAHTGQGTFARTEAVGALKARAVEPAMLG